MIFNYDDEPKSWNNKCPDCGSIIKWSLISPKSGAESVVHCSNNLAASRIGIQELKDLKACFWKGYVVRQKDGGIRFKNKNNEWLKEIIT